MAADHADSAASQVFWVADFAVKDGQASALCDLVREMSEAANANEPQTLIYQWTISDDRRRAQVHERYADSDAALRHLATFNRHYAERVMALVEHKGMTVCGSPSAKLKDALAGAAPAYMQAFGGFVR